MQQKLFPTGNDLDLPAQESPVRKPSETQCAKERADILQALKWAGDSGVSALRMLEISKMGYRQRISEVRKELEKRGLTVVCERNSAGSLYYLRPFRVTT